MIRHAENVNIGSNRASEVGRLQGAMQIQTKQITLQDFQLNPNEDKPKL
jgi:hypothetical protein